MHILETQPISSEETQQLNQRVVDMHIVHIKKKSSKVEKTTNNKL